MPTGSTLRRVDGAAGVLSRWPWLSGRWQTPGDRLGCTPLHATGPARPRAGLRPSGCVWSGHGLPCASAAWPVPVPACRLDAFDRAPGSGAAGVSFALGFRAWPEDRHQETEGGGLLFRKRLRIVELTAPGGSIHGKRQRHPIKINHLERTYFSVTCRGKIAEELWKNCGMVRRAFPHPPIGSSGGLRRAGNSTPAPPLVAGLSEHLTVP